MKELYKAFTRFLDRQPDGYSHNISNYTVSCYRDSHNRTPKGLAKRTYKVERGINTLISGSWQKCVKWLDEH